MYLPKTNPQAELTKSRSPAKRVACLSQKLTARSKKQNSMHLNATAKENIEANNGLEKYCFTMRNTLKKEKLKEKSEAVMQRSADEYSSSGNAAQR